MADPKVRIIGVLLARSNDGGYEVGFTEGELFKNLSEDAQAELLRVTGALLMRHADSFVYNTAGTA